MSDKRQYRSTGTDKLKRIVRTSKYILYPKIFTHKEPVDILNPRYCLLYTSDAADE